MHASDVCRATFSPNSCHHVAEGWGGQYVRISFWFTDFFD